MSASPAFVPALAAPAAPLAPARPRACVRRVRRAARPRPAVRAAAVPVEADENTFPAEVLASSKEQPVLVDFYAPWCGPCKLVAPLMDWAAIEYDGRLKVVKVDTDENASFVKAYGIHGLPTFAVFKDGEAFGVQEGAIGKKGLGQYLEKHAGL